MTNLTSAVFSSREAAARATSDLVEAGVAQHDISIMSAQSNRWPRNVTPAAAVKGLAVGGLLGAVAASYSAAAAITVPMLGLVASGPLVAAMTGAGVGGTTGAILGAILGGGLSHQDPSRAQRSADYVLLGVWSNDAEVPRIRRLLAAHGGSELKVT